MQIFSLIIFFSFFFNEIYIIIINFIVTIIIIVAMVYLLIQFTPRWINRSSRLALIKFLLLIRLESHHNHYICQNPIHHRYNYNTIDNIVTCCSDLIKALISHPWKNYDENHCVSININMNNPSWKLTENQDPGSSLDL